MTYPLKGSAVRTATSLHSLSLPFVISLSRSSLSLLLQDEPQPCASGAHEQTDNPRRCAHSEHGCSESAGRGLVRRCFDEALGSMDSLESLLVRLILNEQKSCWLKA